MASKELIDKLNSLSNKQLIDDYITLDAELDRLESIEIKYYKLEKDLELYKKALSNTIDIFNIDNPYEPMTVGGQLKGAMEELKNE